MHMFWTVNRTCIHTVTHANMNNWKILSSIHYVTLLWCILGEDFAIHKYLSDFPLWQSVVCFLIFLLVAKGPIFVSLLLQHDCCEQAEQQQLHFARKCLGRKWGIKRGKMNQAQWLAPFFRMQKPVGCGTTTRKCQALMDSLPPLRHMLV